MCVAQLGHVRSEHGQVARSELGDGRAVFCDLSTNPRIPKPGPRNHQVPKVQDGAAFSTLGGKGSPGERWGLWESRSRCPERVHLGQSKTPAQRFSVLAIGQNGYLAAADAARFELAMNEPQCVGCTSLGTACRCTRASARLDRGALHLLALGQTG